MKKKKKKPSKTQQPATLSGKQVDSPPPNKTPALPVEPPVSAGDDIYAHKPFLKTYTSHGAPPERIPPTPMELLAFATAIHGSGPLPRKHQALKKLFLEAFVLWRESQYRIKIYSQYILPRQEDMLPVLSEDDTALQEFENLEDFFKYVTGLERNDDARRAFQGWLNSKKPGDPQKEIDYWKRKFVDVSSTRVVLDGVKRAFSLWHRRNRGTAGANNVTLRECYKFVRKVTGLKNKEVVKELFEEWKTHEATTGHQTGEGTALLESLRERFPPWWKEKQAGNANGKDAPKSSRRSASKKMEKSSR